MFTASNDGDVRAWDILNGNCKRTYSGHNFPINCMLVSITVHTHIHTHTHAHSHTHTHTHTHSRTHTHTHAHTHTHIHTHTHTHTHTQQCGRYLYSGSYDKTVRVWDIGTLINQADTTSRTSDEDTSIISSSVVTSTLVGN